MNLRHIGRGMAVCVLLTMIAGCNGGGGANALIGKWKLEASNDEACGIIPEMEFQPTVHIQYFAATAMRPADHSTEPVTYSGDSKTVTVSPAVAGQSVTYEILSANEMALPNECKYQRE